MSPDEIHHIDVKRVADIGKYCGGRAFGFCFNDGWDWVRGHTSHLVHSSVQVA